MKQELASMSSIDTFPDHDMQRYFKMLLNSKTCLNQGPSRPSCPSLVATLIAAALFFGRGPRSRRMFSLALCLLL